MRISTPDKEGVFQASKYLKYQVLCDVEELKILFENDFRIFHFITGEEIPKETFLRIWAEWIEGLKEGKLPLNLRDLFACCFTTDDLSLWKQQLPNGKFLLKISSPVIVVEAHEFIYSEGQFHSMVRGNDSIFWGMQMMFPQIYQDPKLQEFREVKSGDNYELFQKIKQWVRDNTRATPFLADGKKINATMRLGKNCFSWVNNHPQLKNLCVS
jgi:hypothetical protein